MRLWIVFGVVIGFLNCNTATAQTLEETYANLCSDKATAKSEACGALRQALIAKLQGQDTAAKPAAAAPTAKATAAAVAPSADAAHDVEMQQSWRTRWGFFADMVGKTWNSASFPGYLTTYQWKKPGDEMEFTTVSPDGKTSVTQSYRWDEAIHSVVNRTGESETCMVIQADGSIEFTNKPGTPAAKYRSVSRQRPDRSVETQAFELKGSEWILFSRSLVVEYLPGAPPPKLEGPLAPLEQQVADNQRLIEEQQRVSQTQPSTKGKRGKVLGTLLIAGVGATAASQFGGNSEQILGGALKGAQIANADNAIGSALATPADTMLAGGPSASSGAGGIGATAGSYPTQPNLALGSCAGFTEANYREKAVSGGGDQQLHTMCGQAFEYYTMYKRAIAQGYSQADAERTYSAHRDAAATASSFLSTHRAN